MDIAEKLETILALLIETECGGTHSDVAMIGPIAVMVTVIERVETAKHHTLSGGELGNVSSSPRYCLLVIMHFELISNA